MKREPDALFEDPAPLPFLARGGAQTFEKPITHTMATTVCSNLPRIKAATWHVSTALVGKCLQHHTYSIPLFSTTRVVVSAEFSFTHDQIHLRVTVLDDAACQPLDMTNHVSALARQGGERQTTNVQRRTCTRIANWRKRLGQGRDRPCHHSALHEQH